MQKCTTEPAQPHPGSQRLEGLRAHLDIKGGYLLLIGGRGQKIAHLGLQWVVHLHVNVIACGLLLVVRVYAAGRTQEGMAKLTAMFIPQTWAKPTHAQQARNQTCYFSLAFRSSQR